MEAAGNLSRASIVAALTIERDRPPIELGLRRRSAHDGRWKIEEVRRIAGAAEDADQAAARIAPVRMAADQVAVRRDALEEPPPPK